MTYQYYPPLALRVFNHRDHCAKPLSDEVIKTELNNALILESCSLEDIDTTYLYGFDSSQDFMMEAITAKKATVKKTISAFGRALNQNLNGTGITADYQNPEISKPRKSGTVAVIAAKIGLSDGQSVSVIFHAPDDDPLVIKEDDTLIAFRFLLNSRDITHAVAPSGGKEVSLKQVTLAISNLAEKNSEKFQAAQAKNNEYKETIETAEKQGEQLETEIATLSDQIETKQATVAKTTKSIEKIQTRIDKQNATQDKLQAEIDALKEQRSNKNPSTPPEPTTVIQPDDDNTTGPAIYWYGMRVRPFDLSSQPEGHTAYLDNEKAQSKFPAATEREIRFGAVAYSSPLSEQQIEHYTLTDLQSKLVEPDPDYAKAAVEDAVSLYVKENGGSLTNDQAESVIDLYLNANGDNRNKIQKALSKQLRKDFFFTNKKVNPEGFKIWDASLNLITEDMLIDELFKHVSVPTKTNSELSKADTIKQAIKDAVNQYKSGMISLTEAKKQIKSAIGKNEFTGSFGEQITYALSQRGKNKFLDAIKDVLFFEPDAPVVDGLDFNEMTYNIIDEHSFFAKPWSYVAKQNPDLMIKYIESDDTHGMSDEQKTNAINQIKTQYKGEEVGLAPEPVINTDLLEQAKRHGVKVTNNGDELDIETPDGKGWSANTKDQDDIDFLHQELSLWIESWEEGAKQRQLDRNLEKLQAFIKGSHKPGWSVTVEPDEHIVQAQITSPLGETLNDELDFVFAVDAENPEQINITTSAADPIIDNVDSANDGFTKLTQYLTSDKEGIFSALNNKPTYLPGEEDYNSLSDEGKALIDATVENFPELVPTIEEPTKTDVEQAEEELKALLEVTADELPKEADKLKAYFRDTLDRQKAIVQLMQKEGKIDEYQPLLLEVGRHMSKLRQSSVS